ncbi:hypothetical protein BD779DRAFT_1682139 [Infundibulicybe gibba]|nr:hypothetical protein BD779DRAFT_1682139 [Infundibulicybe gibba]
MSVSTTRREFEGEEMSSLLGRASPRGVSPVVASSDPSSAVLTLTRAELLALQREFLDAYLRSQSAPPALQGMAASLENSWPAPDVVGGFLPIRADAGPLPLSGSSVTTSRLLHVLAPAPVPLDPLVSVFPIHEVTTLMEGWKRHIPLSNLTNLKRSLAEKSGNTLTNTLVFGPGGLEIQPVVSGSSAEESLTIEEFRFPFT